MVVGLIGSALPGCLAIPHHPAYQISNQEPKIILKTKSPGHSGALKPNH